VELRGVHIGSVGAIVVAPDHAKIDVALDILQTDAESLELAASAMTFRARLESSGITGVKYVDLEPNTSELAPPKLAFTPAVRYIPSRPSLLDMLSRRAEVVGDQVPVLVAHATVVVDKLGHMLDSFDREHLAKRVSTVIDDADAALVEVRRFMRRVDRVELAEKAGAVLEHLDAAAAKAHGLIAKIDGDGDVARAMREIGGAARAFRELVEEVERDPDMLVKGRARSGRQ
jgi:ABC-type transporter Mla subunit MlaD